MSGDITIKAPVAMLFGLILLLSLMVNVYKFAQPSGIVVVGGGGGAPAAASFSGQGGTTDVLQHHPKNSRDAVGPGGL